METTSHPKPVSVKTMNEEIKSKKYQLSHSVQIFSSGTTGVAYHHGDVLNTEQSTLSDSGVYHTL